MRGEISILGAGPVGCALALAFKRAGRAALLCGRPPAPQHAARPAFRPAFRPIALSHASRLILERLGAWKAIAPTPIETIHVSQAGALGRTRFAAADAGVPALGYVVDYGALAEALYARAEAAGVRIAPEAGAAALTVHAEGTSDEAREKRYQQEAVLARVECRPAAASTAFERFTSQGPLALLPLAGAYAVVWGTRPERARALVEAPEAAFLEALAGAFGRRAGEFRAVSERSRVPLALRVRASPVGERQVYVGNAAQTLHPVAGQGLNLGLRDAWELARVLQDAEDPGAPQVLARYAARRRLDAGATVRVTDFLASAFTGANPLAAAARGLGMLALDACTPARRFFARRMIFGSLAMP
jgi:2-octaprenyl-6-methoxyphenol hydroxylase